MFEGLHRETFHPGEIIFNEGEDGDRAYLTGELFSGYATPERLRARP